MHSNQVFFSHQKFESQVFFSSFSSSTTNDDTKLKQQQQEQAAAAIDFARLVGKLKQTPRTGWVRRNVPRYESVADHTWRVAVLSFLVNDESIDIQKCLALAVVHDLAEALVGDIAPDDNVSKQEKKHREHEAMETIVASLQRATSVSDGSTTSKPARQLWSLFEEYEERKSPESIVVKDLDLLDMLIQADEYEEMFETDLSDFFQGTPPSRFQTPILQCIATAAHQRRKDRKIKGKSSVCDDGLLHQDATFVEEYAQASNLDAEDIKNVVMALRARESIT